MGQIHTHYDNLKVARKAPPEVIRAAYKSLSQKHHPDHNPDNPDAMRIIQLINAAYQVLSDPVKRQEHDRWISDAEALESKSSDSYFSQRTTPADTRRNKSSPDRKENRKSGTGSSAVRHKIQLGVRYFFKHLFGGT